MLIQSSKMCSTRISDKDTMMPLENTDVDLTGQLQHALLQIKFVSQAMTTVSRVSNKTLWMNSPTKVFCSFLRNMTSVCRLSVLASSRENSEPETNQNTLLPRLMSDSSSTSDKSMI